MGVLLIINNEIEQETLIDNMFRALSRYGISKKWNFLYAKWSRDKSRTDPDLRSHDTLLCHSLTAASIARQLGKALNFSLEELQIVITGTFLHDYGKHYSSYQLFVQLHQSGAYKSLNINKNQKEIPLNEVEDFLNSINIDKKYTTRIRSIALRNEAIESGKHAIDTLTAGASGREELLDITRLADLLASIKSIAQAITISENPPRSYKELMVKYNIKFQIHQISNIRGVLTQIVHKTMETVFQSNGWVPLLWFPQGTLYFSTNDVLEEIRFSKIEKSVFIGLKKFLLKERGKDLIKSVFGSWTATLLVFPDFVFINDETINQFLQYISKERYVRDSKPSGKDILHITKTLNISKDNEDEIISYSQPRQGLFNLWRIYLELCRFIDVKLKELVGQKVKREVILNQLNSARTKLNVPSEILNGKFSIATKSAAKFTVGEILYDVFDKGRIKSLSDLFDSTTKTLTDNIVEQFHITKEYLSLEPQLKILASQLVTEIVKPFPDTTSQNLIEIYQSYKIGKTTEPGLCFLCSNKAMESGVASIMGDGTESFSNFLAAGTKISNKNKAKTCLLCKWEGLIRKLYLSKVNEIVYLFPHTNRGFSQNQLITGLLHNIIRGLQDKGINPIQRVSIWAKIVFENELEKISKEIGDYFTNTAINAAIDCLEDFLKRNYQVLNNLESDLSSDNYLEWKKSISGRVTHKKIAEGFLKGELKVDIWEECIDEEEYKSRLSESSKFSSVYETPNYALFLMELPVGRKKEPEPARHIKRIFISTLLGVLFQSYVSFGELSSLVFIPEANQGYAKIPKHMTLLPIYKKLFSRHNLYNVDFNSKDVETQQGIINEMCDDWIDYGYIPFEFASRILKQLAALILLDGIIRKTNATFGEANLLRIAQLTPGRLLNRFIQKSDNKIPNWKIVTLLNTWYGNQEIITQEIIGI